MGTSPHCGELAGALPCGDGKRVAAHLLEWQATGDAGCLERAWAAVRPVAQRMIAATLLRLDIHDPSAIDDALSLVLDHLRRLPAASTDDRAVTPFVPCGDPRCNESLADSGLAYILWLSRGRAADVARDRRRRSRDATVFSLLDRRMTRCLRGCVDPAANTGDDTEAQGVLCIRLHDGIRQLPARERLVIELLLEGKSQAVIAHVLDVCEGTVSRLRSRAIATLRERLAE